ncbi:MAG: NADH-quinone oxidoreductase subunit N [Chloroflexi bacterium]|nr:NADH-quinone oxidoreductase subunit N [Chloroflexota bacterium]MCH8284719.1 NADH-quinone oxidoreductase subunit N [Chloroflexota bacterium]
MNVDFSLFIPEFVMAGMALVVLTVDLFLPQDRKHWLPYIALVGILGTMGSVFTIAGKSEELYGGLFLVDNFAVFFKVFLLAVGAFMVLASAEYVKKNLTRPGEFYGILLFSILAMMTMTAAGELLTAYISLELFSFSLYILAAYAIHRPKSVEAGLKYILVGAFSSAILLYGLSLIYGSLGTTTFSGISDALAGNDDIPVAFLAGLVLVIVGFGFKITAVPFHMWAPDVYEGAPTPVTAYLAVASKAVSFALLLRLFAMAFGPALEEWRPIIAGLAAATIVLGNLVAMAQHNIKRMLAYSSIGQAGYLLMGIAALSPLASNGLLFHIVGYSAANFAAFACVIAYENLTGKQEISDYAGLSRRQPFMALVLTGALFSLAGLPVFAGFATKFYLFAAVGNEGLLWLVIVAVAGSLVSLYYYLMVIKQIYLGEPEEDEPLRLSVSTVGLLGALGAAVVIFGVYPGPLIKLIEKATAVLPMPV